MMIGRQILKIAFSIGFFQVFFFFVQSLNAAPYNREMEKAALFLESRRDTLDLVTVVQLQSLTRYHGYQIRLGEAPLRVLKNQPQRLKPLFRELDKKYTVSELELRTLKGAPGLFGTALYCDIYPLPWNYDQTVRRYASGGPYAVTQAIQAMAILPVRNCHYDTEQYARLQESLGAQVPAILKSAAIGTDLWLEAALSLFNLRRGHEIPKAAWRTLLNLQMPNGSWENDSLRTAKVLRLLILSCQLERGSCLRP